MAPPPIIFELNPNSGVPIYRQIVDQAVVMVAGGILKHGDLLPSVRQVAREAAVNPMTVSKAYSRLESDGIVRRVRGTGMEVVATADDSPEGRKLKFRELMEPALLRARQLGLSDEQIYEVIASFLKDQPS